MDVDYASDENTLSETYENRRRTRKTKGRGKNTSETGRNERYSGKSGVFDRLSAAESNDSAQKSVEGWIVFVTGVHEEAQEDDIVDMFSECGQVRNIHVNLDRRTGFVKGYALIEFAELDEAKEAVKTLDGKKLLGQTIHVDWAFTTGTRKASRRQ